MHLAKRRKRSKEVMGHLVDRHLLQRTNTILMLGMVWGALAICALGALAFDVALWFGR